MNRLRVGSYAQVGPAWAGTSLTHSPGATGVDGTLLDEHERVTPRTSAAVRAAVAAGTHFLYEHIVAAPQPRVHRAGRAVDSHGLHHSCKVCVCVCACVCGGGGVCGWGERVGGGRGDERKKVET